MRIAFQHDATSLTDYAKECLWFLQRGWRGYADCDVWSLDIYLSKILGPALRQLARTDHGHPTNMTEPQWRDLLRTMAQGFDREVGEFDNGAENNDDTHLKLFVEYFRHLWD